MVLVIMVVLFIKMTDVSIASFLLFIGNIINTFTDKAVQQCCVIDASHAALTSTATDSRVRMTVALTVINSY